ncbi:hypothetical protein ACIRQQ_44615 [Streptomyces fuscichromogenes]|uniref:hypothetical protein n=1 Tax=Streptomyces fuscichromogenes TaxID=1324013 RepID=UPI0038162BAE
MTPWEAAVAQADVTGHLILYTQAPIVKNMRVRGLLPGPGGAPTVRIALGRRKATVTDLVTIYEIPLFRQDGMLLPWEVVSRIRHEAGEVRFYSGGQVDHVLDTPLIRLAEEVPGEELLEDRAPRC